MNSQIDRVLENTFSMMRNRNSLGAEYSKLKNGYKIDFNVIVGMICIPWLIFNKLYFIGLIFWFFLSIVFRVTHDLMDLDILSVFLIIFLIHFLFGALLGKYLFFSKLKNKAKKLLKSGYSEKDVSLHIKRVFF